jgi:GAF domain-containing protein
LLSQGVDDVLYEPLDAGRFRSRIQSVLRARGLWSDPEEVMKPLIPQDEAERLVEFRLSAAIDGEPEERFDKIARIALRAFSVPFAGISFVEGERQWFKSKQGLQIGDSSRDLSFCGHAINGDEAFVIEDAVLDPRFAQNPLVLEEPHIRFYAGQPVHGPGGHVVGTICVMDKAPRDFTAEDHETLRDLGGMVEQELRAKGKKKVAPPD